ncbi:MAG TPA: CAP domain-containing protein [Thermoleophilaceae bacterium]|nr:CAP domain-containing protein [Thermoleophilaceae bacterium]
MKALRTFVLTLGLLIALTAPTAAAATKQEEASERLIQKINQVRAKHGLAGLREAPKLARTALAYARRLIRVDGFGHGSTYAGAGFRRSGEILALQRGWSLKASGPLHQWLGSSVHRTLMLDPGFRYLGAAPARGNFGGATTTIWVVHFGAH